MDGQYLQFDSTLGGNQILPENVNIFKFATARSQEIAALSEAIDDPLRTGLIFQKMPKHMRRRIMSHKVRRVPKRLREAYQSQLEKCGLPPSTKRPSRKYRRRPSNLLQEYNRRQKKFIWLETHIWHAKRFNMIERWGYKISNEPTDKSFHACYRAITNHCLIQDISYYVCIELKGKEDSILEGLKCLTSTECGLTFAAKYTLTGIREGRVTLFRANKYPFGTIGTVNFMWKPKLVDESSERTLWIWVHPGMYSEVLQELVNIFDFKLEDVEESSERNALYESKEGNNKYLMKLQQQHFLLKISKYFSTKCDVKLNVLKDSLNRFRLTGPLAQSVITQSFRPVSTEVVADIEADYKVQMEDDSKTHNTADWLYEFFNTRESLNSLQEQKLFFDEMKNVASPSQLPAHMILPLTVVDPRLQMPNKKLKAVNSVDENPAQCKSTAIPLNLTCYSPLWEHEWRDKITLRKLTVAEINNIRSKRLVPGIKDDEVRALGTTNVSYLPVILIQNPGSQSTEKCIGFGCGWDILIPAGWAMPVWLSLIFRGARVGGLRETNSLAREMGNILFSPDSKIGQEEEAFTKAKNLEKHFRLPPSKRPNFIKLGIVTPFHCPWKILLNDWNPERNHNSEFFVLRNLSKLNILKLACKKNSNKGEKYELNSVFSEVEISSSLVQVCITVYGRGVIGECSPICLPSKHDFKLLERDKSYRGPVEPVHEDVNESQRKTLREDHLAKLKKLRRKRIKAKQQPQGNEGFSEISKTRKCSPTADLVKKQAEKMRELWLPSDLENVKWSSSRSIIGFVTSGGYSFSESCSYGQGYVTLSCMLELLTKSAKSPPLVLVRTVSSLQYSFAKISVL